MTSAVEGGRGAARWLDRAWQGLLLGGVGVATLVAILLGSSSPILAIVPVTLVAVAFLVSRVPLRRSVAVLLFVALAVDVPSDAGGLWHTPWVLVGTLLHSSLETYLPAFKLSGLEAAVLFLLGLAAWRGARHSALDAEGRVPTAGVVRGFLLLYLAGLLYIEVNGLLHGLPSAQWKLRNLLQAPVLFLLFQSAFRGPADHRLLARLIIWTASIKAVLAIYVQYVFAPKTGGPLDYATNHGDSILFAVAVFILLAQFAERTERAGRRAAAFLVPLLLVGMVANGRRIVWVMLATTLIVLYLITAWGPWKRRVTRGVIIALPIVALYVAAGWTSNSVLFAPIRTFRTVSDGAIDASTLWREIENWNISMSIKAHPIVGVGLGGEYTEFRQNGDLTSFFPEYRGWPHNSVLGLLFLGGVIGFTAMWLLNAAAIFLAARSYRLAAEPDDRTAALTAMATVISCMSLAYGDLGPNFVQYRVFLALALVVAGKLAVSTGAWDAGDGRTIFRVRSVPTDS